MPSIYDMRTVAITVDDGPFREALARVRPFAGRPRTVLISTPTICAAWLGIDIGPRRDSRKQPDQAGYWGNPPISVDPAD